MTVLDTADSHSSEVTRCGQNQWATEGDCAGTARNKHRNHFPSQLSCMWKIAG